MVNTKKMHLVLCVGLLLSIACEKSPVIDESVVEPPKTEIPPVINPPKDSVTKPPVNAKVFEVGTGSGNLTINGQTLNITGNSIIKIKGGSYNNIQISDIKVENATVLITNSGLVELAGNKQMTLSNLKNVTISGDGTPGISKGFSFRDATSGGVSVQLREDINDFTFKYASFKNVKGWSVIDYSHKKVYNGSENSYAKNLKFLHIDCDNVGTLIRFFGSAEDGTLTGLVRNIEIAYVDYKNSPSVGSIVVLENADAYDIHNNNVQNINQNTDNHNGVFYVQGNGKFYNNQVRNHQGNAIRAWAYSIGTSPAEVLIYNNIVINSRQYGAFELQSFSRNIMSGKTTYVNAKVFNNTCGNLLPKGGFPAQVLDLYGLQGGKCEIFNNLAYQLYLVGSNNTNFIYNDMGSIPPKAFNNKYFKTATEAGIADLSKLSLVSGSAAKNKGASLLQQNLQLSANPAINKDIYNNPRSLGSPSIGAVE